MTEYRLRSKEDFIAYLKCQIANIIHIEDNLSTKDGIKPWGLERINYHDNPLQLIRILVTFNVEDTRKMQDESDNLTKKQEWSNASSNGIQNSGFYCIGGRNMV